MIPDQREQIRFRKKKKFSLEDVFDKSARLPPRPKLRTEWTIIRDSTLEFVAGEPVTFGPITYQAIVAPVQSPVDVATVLGALRENEPWNTAVTPFAYRYDATLTMSTTEIDNKLSNNNENMSIIFREGCRDSDSAVSNNCDAAAGGGEDFGAGDKLLNLLVTMDIRNILLLVARWDRIHFSGASSILGRFSALIAAAKAGLVSCHARCCHTRTLPMTLLPHELPKSRFDPLTAALRAHLVARKTKIRSEHQKEEEEEEKQMRTYYENARRNQLREHQQEKFQYGIENINHKRRHHQRQQQPNQLGETASGGHLAVNSGSTIIPRSLSGVMSGGGPSSVAGGAHLVSPLAAAVGQQAMRSQKVSPKLAASVHNHDPEIRGAFGIGDEFIRQPLSGVGHFGNKTKATSLKDVPVFVESQVRRRLRPLLDIAGPTFTRQDVTQMCSFKTPPESLMKILQLLARLKCQPFATWSDILDMLRKGNLMFINEGLDMRKVPRKAIAATRSFLLNKVYNQEYIRRQSKYGITAYEYLIHVMSVVDFIHTGRPPPGSIWVDKEALKKVPLDIKMVVMEDITTVSDRNSQCSTY